MKTRSLKQRLVFGARRFRRDQRGSAVTLFAVFLMVGVGFAAIVIDGGHLYSLKNKLQTAADAAVLVAVSELPDTDAARTAAIVMAGKNMPTGEHGAVLADADVVTGNWDADTRTFTPAGNPINAVRVVTRRSQANGNAAGLFFAAALGFDQTDVEASAIAASDSSLPLCILGLGADPAIEVSGSAVIDAPGCHIHSNQTISVSGAGSINADSTCAVGDIDRPENITPAPQTGCDPIPDPMAGIPEPSFTGCDFDGFSVGGTTTITPGVYCGGLQIEGGADITMEPGLYYLETGAFQVPANATVVGDGVTIYFDANNNSEMQMIGGPSFHLSAPTSGTYAGVAIFGSRSQPPSTRHEFVGTGDLFIDGAVYLPSAELYYQGNSLGSITVAIAYRIHVNGNSTFQRDVSTTNVPLPSGFPGSGAGGDIALVQ